MLFWLMKLPYLVKKVVAIVECLEPERQQISESVYPLVIRLKGLGKNIHYIPSLNTRPPGRLDPG